MAGHDWTDGQQPAIDDYGFLSDSHSAALVERTGSVDWWCVPRFDSPSVFGRLLDPEAGHWRLGPVEAATAQRRYIRDTLVLETEYRVDGGSVRVTEALLLEGGARSHDIGKRSPHTMLRRVEGLSGTVAMHSELAPRMEYGRTTPHLCAVPDGAKAVGGPVTLTLRTDLPVRVDGACVLAEFDVSAGETIELELRYTATYEPRASEHRSEERARSGASGARSARGSGNTGEPPDPSGHPGIEDTLDAWTSWSDSHTGYDGDYADQVRRSSLVLQGLTYGPSGAVIAAATTSLPEVMGGDLNFDYRYAWLRDLSLTMRSLWLAACPDEPSRLFDWLSGSAGHVGAELVQIMYGVEGERDLTERVLPHLHGYRDSAPVRVGNAAWKQDQLDVFGEVLDAAHLLRDQLGELSAATRQMLVALADRAASMWEQPDAGMWESRDEGRHYTSSKVMCWVALDRAIDLAPLLGVGADLDTWSKARAAVRADILDKSWSETAGAYAGAYGSDHLDASVLILPLVDFLPATDERMHATIMAIERELGQGGLVRRWPSDPSGFLICTYWLVECLVLAGAPRRARAWFDSATSHANDLGLLSEEADVQTGEMLGNYPQAFSHVGLINAAWRLGQRPPEIAHANEQRSST